MTTVIRPRFAPTTLRRWLTRLTGGAGGEPVIERAESDPVVEQLLAHLSVQDVQTTQWADYLKMLETHQGLDWVKLFLGRSGHAKISADELSRVEREVAKGTKDQVLALFPGDAMLTNFVLNLWEWANGVEELESLPWNVSLPISDVCNARCNFCTSWLEGRKMISMQQLEMFAPVLQTAQYVGLIGHGEPMSHPKFGEIGDRLDEYLDPRAVSYTITNGVFLDKLCGHLDKLRLKSVSISLNAASAETHAEVMGFPPTEFPRIIQSIREIRAGKHTNEPMPMSITMVVTQQNVHEVADFVRLGNELNVTSIYVRTLLPQAGQLPGLNYHTLPPYQHPQFEAHREAARRAIAESAVPVISDPDSWSNLIFPEDVAERFAKDPPPMVSRAKAVKEGIIRSQMDGVYQTNQRLAGQKLEPGDSRGDLLDDGSNPQNREAPFRCRAVYNNFYVNELYLREVPCCYLQNTPGYEETRLPHVDHVRDAWNSPANQALRRSLAQGPLYSACRRCPENW